MASRIACHDSGTILGRRDFVVIVRRWRSMERFGVPACGLQPAWWTAVSSGRRWRSSSKMGWAPRCAPSAPTSCCHKVREEDRERILDRLNSRTTADIERDLALRRAATLRLARQCTTAAPAATAGRGATGASVATRVCRRRAPLGSRPAVCTDGRLIRHAPRVLNELAPSAQSVRASSSPSSEGTRAG